jgi:CheY-like chemotaxis protein
VAGSPKFSHPLSALASKSFRPRNAVLRVPVKLTVQSCASFGEPTANKGLVLWYSDCILRGVWGGNLPRNHDFRANGCGSESCRLLSSSNNPGYAVLLAEDHPLNQTIARKLLEMRGCRVTVAHNGWQALNIWNSSPNSFDIILMDIQMPEMDGLEAARRIRSIENGTARHIPILAYSASSWKADLELCLSAGMDGYILKPIEPRQLYQALETAITSRRRNHAAENSGDRGTKTQ